MMPWECRYDSAPAAARAGAQAQKSGRSAKRQRREQGGGRQAGWTGCGQPRSLADCRHGRMHPNTEHTRAAPDPHCRTCNLLCTCQDGGQVGPIGAQQASVHSLQQAALGTILLYNPHLLVRLCPFWGRLKSLHQSSTSSSAGGVEPKLVRRRCAPLTLPHARRKQKFRTVSSPLRAHAALPGRARLPAGRHAPAGSQTRHRRRW